MGNIPQLSLADDVPGRNDPLKAQSDVVKVMAAPL
jgi:hypothetical protein